MPIPTLRTNLKDSNGLYDNDLDGIGKYAEISTGWIIHVTEVVINQGVYEYLCSASNLDARFIQTAKQLEEEFIRIQGE